MRGGIRVNRLVLYQVLSGVDTFLNVLSIMLVIYALMTWFMRPNNPVYIFFARIADVAMTPFRPIGRWLFEKGLRIDLTLYITLVAIQLLRNLLTRLFYSMWMY